MSSTERQTRDLLRIKLLHTVIWVFFVMVIGYIVYAGIANVLGPPVWIAIGLIVLEGVILLLNNGSCPLTPMAARYTDRREDNFDIFLPLWLARYNKQLFGGIFFLAAGLVVYRALS